MSLSRPNLGDPQALQHRKMALWRRLRQNLLLKIISLAASILLYAFVQQERNPTTTRQLMATVAVVNLPRDVEIENDTPQVEVQVTGPRSLLDQIKDGDIKARADFRNVPIGESHSVKVSLNFDKPSPELVIEPALRSIKVQVYLQKTRQVEVKANYNSEAPVGLRYDAPEIKPRVIKVKGREDRVNRVEQAVVNALASEPMSTIDGDFPVSLRDSDNNPIEGVTPSPETVHVTVHLSKEPYAKIVSVSANITDQLQPPYRLADVVVMPNQARIIGRPERVNPISTVTTEEISIHDLMENKTLEVNLVPIPDVVIRDLQGHPLTHVTVQIMLRKSASGPSASPNTGPPP